MQYIIFLIMSLKTASVTSEPILLS